MSLAGWPLGIWLPSANSAGSLFIDPGSRWQNAWIESFNGRLPDELLNSWRFDSLLEPE
ncbi:transposase InsO family protein [Mycolicibacterium fluoranthenivorans]|uniref:Transposase InsO family protein n=1 Tax=Mycolicibacterium fluoranthenivorans TaxID=258505 RepID=A0A7X5U2K3_9MYCO|nr:transposase InsO family protein [Mycolicibacterium fluoranthenivorans]